MQRDENANERGRGRGMQGIRGADLRFLDQLLMTDLWILDRQANQITIGTGRGDLSYRELDIDAQAIGRFSVREVLSRQFSSRSDIITESRMTTRKYPRILLHDVKA